MRPPNTSQPFDLAARLDPPPDSGSPCERCHVGTAEVDLHLYDGEWWCVDCCLLADAEHDADEPYACDDEPVEPSSIDENELTEETAA